MIDLDTTNFGKYNRTRLDSFATALEAKLPVTLKFRSLEESLSDPGEMIFHDFMKIGRADLWHAAYRGLEQYRAKHGDLPPPQDAAAAAEVVTFTKEIAAKLPNTPDVDDALVSRFVRTSRAVLGPMASILGGIIGQEVMKTVSNRLHPIYQWFYFDAMECLPADDTPVELFAPLNSRYDAQISCLGSTTQKQLGALKYFVVGSGALGCELLKNFATMGLACDGGEITLTDDDIIERSNLSRQFLFRNYNVGHSKATVAPDAVKEMNPNINVRALQERVQPDSETIFNDAFWESLDGVANALDNVKARHYVDQRCVFFQKPLLESGTMGTKCNVQVILPHLTANYGSRSDPETKEAPECALHNFPHTINHCLSLARSEFIGRFSDTPAAAVKFLSSPDYVDELSKQIWDSNGNVLMGKIDGASNAKDNVESLQGILDLLTANRCTSFWECIAWARLLFEEFFANRIKQLVHAFPADAKNSSGGLFWSPPKRFPTPLKFDDQDPTHIGFIVAAANLKAEIHTLPKPATNRDVDFFRKELVKVVIPDFQPKSDFKIDTGEKKPEGAPAEEPVGGASDVDTVAQLLKDLPPRDQVKDVAVASLEFEKDDDTNFHMDFIHAFANLRGRNYNLQEVDKLQAKLIAGRIIPALASTTAMVTGFVCLELLKVAQKRPLEDFRDLQANLALPQFMQIEAEPAKRSVARVDKQIPDPINHPDYVEETEIVTYPEDGFTVWDRIDVRQGDITVDEFIRWWKESKGLTLTCLNCHIAKDKAVAFYNNLLKGTEKNRHEKISSLYHAQGGKSDATYIVVECLFENEDDLDVETPTVVYHFQ